MTLRREKDLFPGQIVEEASEGLYRYAIVLSRDRVEAQDLVQETCVRAIEAVDSLRHGANVKSWLFTILRNIWFNQLRRRRAAPKLVELDMEETMAVLKSAERVELVRLLKKVGMWAAARLDDKR